MENENNRRSFQRIFFESTIEVITDTQGFSTQLNDLSLNGALVQIPPGWNPDLGQTVTLNILLSDGTTNIKMDATVTHIENKKAGLKRDHIDMESISHLRRLVELNLGDDALLHRELEHLIEPSE